MKFTDIFIKRSVLASVLSILILLFGLRALYQLPIRQYPEMSNTVISVTTGYGGANADLIQGFITTPLQRSIASADGIDYLTATSNEGVSVIKAHIKLNYNPDIAFTNIMAKVSQTRSILPSQSDSPVIVKGTGQSIALLYIAFNSKTMSQTQISDYISRVVQPKLETITGVAQAQILGNNEFAMRVWLNPQKMAAMRVSASDVANTLRTNNYLTTAGKTKGLLNATSITINTDLHRAEEFKNIIVKQDKGNIVRLKDVADVKLSALSTDSSVIFNGEKAIFIAVTASPSANPLTVIKQVKQVLPEIQKAYPPGLNSKVVYDATQYISSSIKEVIKTLGEATLIVIGVIYLFLGAWRSVLIPVLTIPLSLIGVCSLMLLLGYSINLLTLLAMVLAIGLVVDDAIVVVENIHRHIENDESPMNASLKGAREITAPVIAMTITLACVYTPIGFMEGLTGALFKEFAFTLACAVIISGFIALVLSPMMCSKIFTGSHNQPGFVKRIDKTFDGLKAGYGKWLNGSLNYRPVTLLFAITTLMSCAFLYVTSAHELAPKEDQSALFISATAPQNANIDYVEKYTSQFNKIFKAIPEKQDYFIINGLGSVNNVISGLILKPWEKRTKTQEQIQPGVQNALQKIPGLNSVVFPLPSLPIGGGGLPVQFLITSTGDYQTLFELMTQLQQAANQSGLFLFVDSDLKFNNPELTITVNRDKASQLGISMQSLGSSLSTLLGGNSVNRFSMQGRSYYVVPQVKQRFRLDQEKLKQIYVKTSSGDMIPLSAIATIKASVQPNQLKQFQQLHAATLQGMLIPGKSLGEGLGFLEKKAQEILPKGYGIDYSGQSRRFMQEGQAMLFTFLFALIVIYLVLAALFESFRDPFIIIVSVPLSICGALIPINLGAASINIFTQIGLVTLIGLITKHGILMVQFANQLRDEGTGAREAILQAAEIRLRPILMTTFAMILGVLPLLLASGAGAASRYSIGLVILSGMSFGTLFTLFVVPMMYISMPAAKKVFALLAAIGAIITSTTLAGIPVTYSLISLYIGFVMFCFWGAFSKRGRCLLQPELAKA